MNLSLIFIDKVSNASIQNLIHEYESRVKHYCNLDIITITVPKNVRQKSIEEQKQSEEKLIKKYIKGNDFIVLLDENAQCLSSMEFSKWLEKNISAYKRIVFIVGGPYGFSKEFKESYYPLSLSKMTFSHEMVRVLFLEQLYRAFTIIKSQKYHHE